MKKILLYIVVLVVYSTQVYSNASEHNLLLNGVKYYNEKNYHQAWEIIYPLAKKGNSNAQYWVGYMYETNTAQGGKTGSKSTAIEWYELSSKNGFEAASQKLSTIKIGQEPTFIFNNNITHNSTAKNVIRKGIAKQNDYLGKQNLFKSDQDMAEIINASNNYNYPESNTKTLRSLASESIGKLFFLSENMFIHII